MQIPQRDKPRKSPTYRPTYRRCTLSVPKPDLGCVSLLSELRQCNKADDDSKHYAPAFGIVQLLGQSTCRFRPRAPTARRQFVVASRSPAPVVTRISTQSDYRQCCRHAEQKRTPRCHPDDGETLSLLAT